MNYEVRNILIYFKIFLVLFLRGKFLESFTNLKGAFVRIYESFVDLFLKSNVTCNYCNWQGSKFRTIASTVKLRSLAICPKCLSLDRHREMLEVFIKVTELYPDKKLNVLDIAPNIAFTKYCQSRSNIDYLSIDLQSQFAMQHMDIQNLEISDNSFDIIVCYHVLDYVENDFKGMCEIFRVLKPSGFTITQEGIDYELEHTVEWNKPKQLEEYRIRQYGKDFFNRWKKADFQYIFLSQNDIILSFKKENQLLNSLLSIFNEDCQIY